MNLSNSANIAFVFPGQGSQFVGMGKALSQEYPLANDIFQQADEIVKYPLSRLAWDGPEDQLNDTLNTQPALFTHSIAVLRVLQSLYSDIKPGFVAGHSMGEISALVASGALSFPDGLKLVKIRGELMKNAGDINPGGMAAVLGVDLNMIDQLCIEASSGLDIVQVANDNCPGQVVISGSNFALDRVQILLEKAGARRIIRLAVSIAAHSPFMSSAQDDFNKAVASTPLNQPLIPIVGNVTAQPLVNITDIRDDLQNQLTHRVRWTESIKYLVGRNISLFVEVGSGSVLSGLIKRIDRNVSAISIESPVDFQNLQNMQ
jgi:[acyl-carrier-protein] S-malonyltransferase